MRKFQEQASSVVFTFGEPWLDNGTVDECEYIRVYISEKPLFVPTNDKYATY